MKVTQKLHSLQNDSSFVFIIVSNVEKILGSGNNDPKGGK